MDWGYFILLEVANYLGLSIPGRKKIRILEKKKGLRGSGKRGRRISR